MAFVQCTKVSLAFGDRDILKSVALNLASGSRAALTGSNGSGKTTLMRVIAGLQHPDSGELAIQKGSRVYYLPQSGVVHRGRTLLAEAEMAYSDVVAMLNAMEAIGRALESARQDTPQTQSMLDEYRLLEEKVEQSGYYLRAQHISLVLSGLGFAEADFARPVEHFSGGWQMRIALAKNILANPDIMLLDEPTNYLDIEARSWLVEWLQSFTGGYLLVCHDRYFLDETVSEIFELFQGNLKRYVGNYSAYEKMREVELDSLIKRYKAQQEDIAKAEALIRRFRYKPSKAAMVQERVKMLEKLERIELPEAMKKIHISFPSPPKSGRIALSIQDLGKCYGEQSVIRGLDLTLESGERLLVAGRNGAGKSSLLRILAGQDSDFSGSFQYGAGISVGYFSQDAAETLGGQFSALEYLEEEAPTSLIPNIRNMMGAFLFRGDDVYKSVSVLSGGEKSRLALLKMLLKPVNLLILDEPTNHLDIYSKDILQDALLAYTGTVIFVSHDRSFMEALSTKTLELNPWVSATANTARLFYGNYAYYLDRMHRESEESPSTRYAISATPASGEAALPIAASKPQGVAEQREADKQRQASMRRLQRQEAEILHTIMDLETRKKELEAELSRPEIYASGEKARAVKKGLDETVAAIAQKTQEWEAKALELEEF